MALFGPLLAPYDETAMITLPRQAPSAGHWFGTDEIGRDILSRLLVGARTALMVGTIAVSIGLGVGGLIGIVAAYFGGWLDAVLMRVVDVLLAFPGLLLALAVITFLGPGLVNTNGRHRHRQHPRLRPADAGRGAVAARARLHLGGAGARLPAMHG